MRSQWIDPWREGEAVAWHLIAALGLKFLADAVRDEAVAVMSDWRLRRRWQHRLATASVRRESAPNASGSHYDPREQDEPEYHEEAHRSDYLHDRNGSPNGRAWAGSYRG